MNRSKTLWLATLFSGFTAAGLATPCRTLALSEWQPIFGLPAGAVIPILIAGVLLLFLIAVAALVACNLTARRVEKRVRAEFESEQKERELQAEALEAARSASAAKSGFMSRISHEIRTPLNAIIGYNTIARSEMEAAKTDEERRHADMRVLDCLTKSELASRHLLTVINDVLDMSAIESGRIRVAHERFDFKALITSLTAIFYTQAASKGIEFSVVIDTLTEEWFIGDQMRVNQVLTNLLSNAIKFTPAGGSVKLVIRQPEAAANAAHIHFEVVDTGIGMEKEYLEHIWTPFEQADATIARRFGGSGLGLSITKGLVDCMNGSISVESELNVGTRFSVELTFERTEQPASTKTYDFSNIRALVVDDDQSTCDYVRLLFTRSGAHCRTVTSGSDAVRVFADAEERGERFTVCIVDWHMPEMDGLETVKSLKSIAKSDVPIIIITAYDFSEIADKARSEGVHMFVSKPLFQSSLFDLLANISGQDTSQKLKRSAEYDFTGARVLLAEDNVMNMEVAKRVLASVGLTVDSAKNGSEAVALFEAAPPKHYDAILMDIQMPEMDGHQATRAIRASAHPDAAAVPIIAMTADAFAENIAEALEAGMNDHISKPIDTQMLFETLLKYIPSDAK